MMRLIVIVVAAVSCASCSAKQAEAPANVMLTDISTTEAASSPTVISASALARAFIQNRDADLIYGAGPLLVDGTVHSVQSHNGASTIDFRTGDSSDRIAVQLRKGPPPRVGQMIAVRCAKVDGEGEVPVLSDCAIDSVAD